MMKVKNEFPNKLSSILAQKPFLALIIKFVQSVPFPNPTEFFVVHSHEISPLQSFEAANLVELTFVISL
jgi:hypothetical protein